MDAVTIFADLEWLDNEFLNLSHATENEYATSDEECALYAHDRERASSIIRSVCEILGYDLDAAKRAREAIKTANREVARSPQ